MLFVHAFPKAWSEAVNVLTLIMKIHFSNMNCCTHTPYNCLLKFFLIIYILAHIQLCIQMCWELVAKTTHYSKEHWLWFTSHPLEYDSSEVARPLRCSKIWKTRNGKCLRQAQNATAKIPTHAQQFNYSMECHILCTTPWLSLTHTQCVNGLMVILSGATAFWLMFWQMWEQHECMGPSVTQISLDHHTHIVEKQLSLPLDHIFCPLIIVHPNEGE